MSSLLRLLVVLALVVPGAARAYVRTTVTGTDTCLFWTPRTLPWSAASPLGGGLGEDATLAAVRRSFDVWESEACSDLAFAEGGRVGREIGYGPGDRADGVVVIRDRNCRNVVPAGDPCWQEESCSNEYDCWDGSSRQIAVTIVTFNRCTGEILDADIEANGAGFRFTVDDGPTCTSPGQTGCVQTDLENTLVHEIGHFIGLDHTPDREATMYDQAPTGETSKRTLADDDRDALCTVYPAGAETLVCEPAVPPEECRAGGGGEAGGCSSGAGAATVLGAAAALLLFLRSRRRG